MIVSSSEQTPWDRATCSTVEWFRRYAHSLRRNTEKLCQLSFHRQWESNGTPRTQILHKQLLVLRRNVDQVCSAISENKFHNINAAEINVRFVICNNNLCFSPTLNRSWVIFTWMSSIPISTVATTTKTFPKNSTKSPIELIAITRSELVERIRNARFPATQNDEPSIEIMM